MKASILILNYNVSHFLDICLLSVKAAIKNHEVEIIVVDNASSDDSVNTIKKFHPDVKLIENLENSGYPQGNNLGFKYVKGEWLLVLNPDVIVPEDLFDQLFAKENHKNQGISGCYLLDGCGQFLPESKRLTPTPWVAMTKILGLYKIFPNSKWFNQYYAMHLDKNQSGEVDILVGAFMWMKSSLYEQLNGFDENCFMYADDIDLSYRAKLLGFQNQYFSNIKVLHFKGESTSRDKTYVKRFNEAMVYFYRKHFKGSVLFTTFMQVMSYFFSLKKAFEKPLIPSQTNTYFLYPQNDELCKRLQNGLKKNISTIHNLNNINKKACVIFDQSQLSFQEILENMTTFANRDLSFRICPKDRNYLIGSDSKNGKGEIAVF